MTKEEIKKEICWGIERKIAAVIAGEDSEAYKAYVYVFGPDTTQALLSSLSKLPKLHLWPDPETGPLCLSDAAMEAIKKSDPREIEAFKNWAREVAEEAKKDIAEAKEILEKFHSLKAKLKEDSNEIF